MGDLKIDIKFARKLHFGVRSNTGAVKGTAISLLLYRGANQADVYYCIHLQVDIGINMGMYNGVTSRHSILIHTN